MTVTLRGAGLTEDQVVEVARHGEKVALAAAARTRMEISRARVERAASSREPVYGVSTGFGALAGTRIAPLRQPELQLALIRSHAAGVGPPVDVEVVRATMLLRARTLAMGMSGVRPFLADALIAMLNAEITPVVPRYGSVGCSGDLAPLAHIGLALVGEGDVADAEGLRKSAAQALKSAKLKPVRLETKEGLALINGTDGMLGMLVLACADAQLLFRTADVTAAMSAEALLGTDRAIQSREADAWLADRHVAPALAACGAGLLLGAMQPAGGRGRARHARLRAPHRRGGAVIGHRQPDRSRERRCGVERELPRRAARLRRGFSGHRRRQGWLDRRAPRRPPARSAPLPGPAALPGRRAWRELRADGCPVHGRGAGRGKPPACRARKRRLGAHVRHAGGPRLDGLGRGAEAPLRARQPVAHPRGRAVRGRARAGAAPAARAIAGHR